jgi:hypothetical protein
VLGLERSADEASVKKAYRKASVLAPVLRRVRAAARQPRVLPCHTARSWR